MPYMLITTQIRLENGPTIVGDANSNPELMQYLEAELTTQLGNTFQEWRTSLFPRQVLDKLELKGYHVVTMTGVGQSCIWMLYKPLDAADVSKQ